MTAALRANDDDGFSEFTYGMLLTMELIAELGGMSNLTAAPMAPSQVAEADLGFDMSLESQWGLLCFQFKLSRRMVGANAGQASVMGVPYYRFDVKTDLTRNGKCQHNTMCDLDDQLSKEGGAVRYAAPVFVTSRELAAFARASEMNSNSVFPGPWQLGVVVPDSTHHYAYSSPKATRACSDPGPETAATLDDVLDELELPSKPLRRLDEFLSSCEGRMRNILGGELDVSNELGPAHRVALLMASVGMQAIVVRHEPSESSQEQGQADEG